MVWVFVSRLKQILGKEKFSKFSPYKGFALAESLISMSFVFVHS